MTTATETTAPALQPAGPVPPDSLGLALAHLLAGGVLVIPTAYRVTVIKQRDVAAWDKAGLPLLRVSGNGYRLRQGRKGASVYLLPGQLRFA